MLVSESQKINSSLSSSILSVARFGAARTKEHGAKGALGNNTESVHGRAAFVEVVDEITGEVQRFNRNKSCEYVQDFDHNAVRSERYAMQNVSSKILSDRKTPKNSKWRVCDCMRKRIGDDVRVLLDKEHNKAHFGNLSVCGSIWTCPVCGAKISERRKIEIEKAANSYQEQGGHLYMITLTFSHHRTESIFDLIGDSETRTGLKGALKRFRNSRGYKDVTSVYELDGLIRNLELTWSKKNGWHPHVHELWFFPHEMTSSQLCYLRSELFRVWKRACLNSGLGEPSEMHGIDIVKATSPAAYLQKFGREQIWSVGSELAKSHTKKAKSEKGLTPFDLLRKSIENSEDSSYFSSLFSDYASALFGTRQCFWTNGLKKRFSIDELTDEELAAQQDVEAEEVTSIDKDDWKKVIAFKPFDARCIVLFLAETGGKPAIDNFIAGLPKPTFKKNRSNQKIQDKQFYIPEIKADFIITLVDEIKRSGF